MDVIALPRLGVTMKSGKVTHWHKKVGDTVEIGELFFEMESDKANVEVESQHSGVVRAILVKEGIEVPVGQAIAIVAAEYEEIDLAPFVAPAEFEDSEINKEETPPAPVPVSVEPAGARVSPRVRKLAAELGVSLEGIIGTGPGGVIREEDLKKAAAGGLKIKEKVKQNGIRKAMAKNIMESWSTIPQFTQIVMVNANNLLKTKKEIGNVSVNDILIKAVANVVADYPIVNSKLENDEVLIYDDINVSVAMLTENGLIVPVVRNVGTKAVNQVSQEIRELSARAQNNELTMDDFADGTITVSNLGPYGIECGTPIINSPQSTIVFVGSINKVPVVNEQNEVEIGSVMRLSIGYDHRFIDGATAAGFTSRLKQAIENVSADKLS